MAELAIIGAGQVGQVGAYPAVEIIDLGGIFRFRLKCLVLLSNLFAEIAGQYSPPAPAEQRDG